MCHDLEADAVILASKPDSWDGLYELYCDGEVVDDFMEPADRELQPQKRDPFAGWNE